jgi:hypothetical protein
MAWWYMMAIHVGEYSAYNLVHKYAGQCFAFNDDGGGIHDCHMCRLRASAEEVDGEWWCHILPEGVTCSGIANVIEAERANQFCNVMYGMLRNDAHFDFAIAAVECSEFRSMKEMKEELEEMKTQDSNLDGLVVNKGLLKLHEVEHKFEPFSKTHMWIPKKPEVWESK